MQKRDQSNNDRRGDISILPTVVANNVQFRGKLGTTDVLRFLCNGFSSCLLPDMCGDLVPRDEHACAVGCPGYQSCALNKPGGACTETQLDPGFSCGCAPGYAEVFINGQPTCQDRNECAFEAQSVAKCNCPRCVCHNLPVEKGALPSFSP